MADVEHDPRVASLLTGAGDEITRFIRPQGVAAAERTVRHRRRNRVVGVAVLALALISVPVAAVSLTGGHRSHPPVVNGPSPSPTGASSPSAPPSPSAAPSESPAPDGRISASELRNATLDIPAWPKGFDADCPTGAVTFVNGSTARDLEILDGDPVYVDVDHDGARETAVLVSCRPQGRDGKVLVFDRDVNGDIVTLGQVVGSAGSQGHQGVDILTIWGVRAGEAGQVQVDVGEYRPCCSMKQASQHQWRTYAWNGKRFTQVAGPTVFGPNPLVSDLRATAPTLTVTKQPDGSWQSNLRATIHNDAEFDTPGVIMFWVFVPNTWTVTPVAGSGCQVVPDVQPQECRLPVLASGAERVVDLTVSVPSTALTTSLELYARTEDAVGLGYPDRHNQRTVVPIVRG